MYTLLIGGTAGQGVDTTAGMLEMLLKRAGLHVYVLGDVMSGKLRDRDSSVIGFGTEQLLPKSDWLDGIVALDGEMIERFGNRLKSNGFIVCDSSLSELDPRVVAIDIGDIARKLGNSHVSGSAAVGVVMKLFGLNLSQLADVLEAFIISQYADVNLKAVTAGYVTAAKRYELVHEDGQDSRIVSGGAHMTKARAAILKLHSPAFPSSAVIPDATQYPDMIRPARLAKSG